MAINQIKTFGDIISAILRRCKLSSDDTDAIDAIKEFINTRNQEICTGPDAKYSWLYENRDLIINARYSTGTVAVTNGSRVVQGTSTVWTNAFLGRKFYISSASMDIYTIIAIDTVNQKLFLSADYQGSTVSGSAYFIYQDEYGLWPDLDDIESVYHDYYQSTLTPISSDQMDQLHIERRLTEGWASHYTVSGMKSYEGVALGKMVLGYDFLGAPDSLAMTIFPSIYSQSYVMHVKYAKKVPELVDDGDEPLVPIKYRNILVYGAASDYLAMQNDTMAGFFNSKYEQILQRLRADIKDTSNKTRIVATKKHWANNSMTFFSGTRFNKTEVDL